MRQADGGSGLETFTEGAEGQGENGDIYRVIQASPGLSGKCQVSRPVLGACQSVLVCITCTTSSTSCLHLSLLAREYSS